jgi:hypothetical protein
MEIVRSRHLTGEFATAIPKGALLHSPAFPGKGFDLDRL